MNSQKIIALVGFLVLSVHINAAVLVPGGVIFPVGETVAGGATEQAGVVQNDNLLPFSVFPYNEFQTVGGNVQNRVVLSNETNTLIFSPRIRDTFNIATINWDWIAFRLDGFAGWDTDVDFRLDGLGDVGPTSVSRSADGDTMTFRYDTPIHVDGLNPPGLQEESLFPSILTNATDFDYSGVMTIIGVDQANPDELFAVRIEGIAAPVPVPASLPLFVAALAGLTAIRRRFLR